MINNVLLNIGMRALFIDRSLLFFQQEEEKEHKMSANCMSELSDVKKKLSVKYTEEITSVNVTNYYFW